MKNDVLSNIKLSSVDDLFTTEEERQNDKREKITEVRLNELYPFKDHPFKVKDDEKMNETVESVKLSGVLTPIIVRARDGGGYEIISGHRRKRACELANINTIPAIVKQLTDEEAVIFMVDSNLQRETVLPSEKAFAYKMRLDAMKRQGRRTDLTSVQIDQKYKGKVSRELLAEQLNVSSPQVARYIRLTNLTPDLLELVDEKKMAFNPAVELSYLSSEFQSQVQDVMDAEQVTPSLSQAQRIKRYYMEGSLSRDKIEVILQEEKAQEKVFTIRGDKLMKYFPRDTTPAEVEETLMKLLDAWSKKKSQPER